MNPNRKHATTFYEMISSFWLNRSLIAQLVRREVIGRYRGSLFGIAWSFLNPIIMLIIYTFVFSVVFNARWGTDSEQTHSDFAIILFVGMILHGLFAEVAQRSPGIILSNISLVKRVVFPLEILPLVVMGSALFHAAISLLVLVIAKLFLTQHLPWTGLLFPLVLIPLSLGTMGISWFLASIGVFVRDVSQTIGIVTTIMLFLAPVFYPISALPESYQFVIQLNPLTFAIEEGRNLLLFGKLPNWGGWVLYGVVSVASAWGGFWWFQRTRKGFADVI